MMQPWMVNRIPNPCEECGKVFFSQSTLRDHRVKVHPKRIFKCHHCSHASKTKQHLVTHMKVHFNRRIRPERFPCPMCSHRACDRSSMLRHYAEAHGVSLTPEKYEFKDYDEFLEWKSSLRKKEHCSYVSNGGPHKTVNKVIRQFRCFRDGFYTSRGKGKRRLKLRGSDKINGICPSAISISQDRHSGIVIVTYIATHVGHDTDVGRLNLSREEREAIARKIAAKVPFEVILDEYRESGINWELGRANLLTRKDLWNIAQSYHLTDGTIHPNDWISVEVNQINEDSHAVDSLTQEEKPMLTGDMAEDGSLNKILNEIRKDKISRYRAIDQKDVHQEWMSRMHQNGSSHRVQLEPAQSIQATAHPSGRELISDDDKFERLVENMLAMTKRHPGQISPAVMGDAEKLVRKMTAISDDLANAKLLLSM